MFRVQKTRLLALEVEGTLVVGHQNRTVFDKVLRVAQVDLRAQQCVQ